MFGEAVVPMSERKRPAFERMGATLLACPKCRRAVRVRKRLLLILPEGEKYEYLCPECGSTCGSTIEAGQDRRGFPSA
jgi:ribosomal protein L37AE/L43A